MAVAQVSARLDVIQLAAIGLTEPGADASPLAELIVTLCEKRHDRVADYLTPDRVRLLSALSPEEYERLAEFHGLPTD